MPQIAQQDYLVVDLGVGDDFAAAFPQEKATDFAKRGIIFDAVFRQKHINGNVSFLRILSYDMDENEMRVKFLLLASGDGTSLIEYE